MSCDHELANEWSRCRGKNASYITTIDENLQRNNVAQQVEGFCWQRERLKTKGLRSKTIDVHVRYSSWYISLPSTAKQQREMTKFSVVWRTCPQPLIFRISIWN